VFEETCILCKGSESSQENPLQDGRKGVGTLLKYAKNRTRDINLVNRIEEQLSLKEHKIKVHRSCQRFAYNESRKRPLSPLKEAIPEKKSKIPRSTFDWKSRCLFCGEICYKNTKKPERNDCHEVTQLRFKDEVLLKCQKRGKEAEEVEIRVRGCYDLVATDARYHKSCLSLFYNLAKPWTGGKYGKENIKSVKVGRPEEEQKRCHFEQLCEWMEYEAELYTVTELRNEMIGMVDSETVYTTKWLKKKLKDKYKDHIFFAELNGKSDVVCLKDTASLIINNAWYEAREKDAKKDSERIIKTAAKLILADIRTTKIDKEYYPTEEEIADINFCENAQPTTLRQFLEIIVKDRLKRASLGQCLMMCARPRSGLLPIPFGLSVELDNMFGSRWLIDEVSKLGFAVSYYELQKFKQAVLIHDDSIDATNRQKPEFTQWIGDNVDHNVCTIDGKNTFHGMGIISSSMRSSSLTIKIPRIKKLLKVGDITESKGIPLLQYINEGRQALATVKLTKLKDLPDSINRSKNADLIWQMGYFFKKEQPQWSGFMQRNLSGDHPGKANFCFLPIINLSSSDESCIYSTLVFIENQAKTLNIPTACVTFDQPLYIKAFEIVEAKKLKIVLRLGGFHMLMSFLGGIGTVMKGSGLHEAMETIYASNTVNHMMDGKAYARAVRCHLIIDAVLHEILLKKLIYEESEMEEEDLCRLKDAYNMVTENGFESLNTDYVNSIEKISSKLKEYIDKLSKTNRTAKLWKQYMYHVSLVKDFIFAERTGDWSFHLITVKKMLNLYAASGRVNYAKSARLYLQTMNDLPQFYPWLFHCFNEKGYHAIRRSDRYWAGLWSDLIIEQVLMSAVKSRGGLSRGRGMTDSVISTWCLTMHRLAAIHQSMSKLTDHRSQSSEQHVETRTSRMERDSDDQRKVLTWFEEHPPFSSNVENLVSISNGLTANKESKINCDEVEEIGKRIQETLNDTNYTDAKIKRNDGVKNLAALQSSVKIGDDQVTIDPMTLFNRLIALVMRDSDVSSCFKYELSPFPTSLFDKGVMRDANKSKLREHLTKGIEQCNPPDNSNHVIDGGALLHKIKWLPDQNFKDVVTQYQDYLVKAFGRCTVVFDGYDRKSTKDHKHQIRGSGLSQKCTVEPNRKVAISQKEFMKNGQNKKMLIELLTQRLRSKGFHVEVAKSDADTMIVKEALRHAEEGTVVVHVDDADIFCMLMYHYDINLHHDIYFKTMKKTDGIRKCWKIRDVNEKHGEIIVHHILFLHAWTGCDTTSGTFGMGKIYIFLF
jgi:hypothetical protein